jgi:hypothetical protein
VSVRARRSGRTIHITRHAQQRLQQRAPSLTVLQALREVADALDGGRIACNPPAWAPSINRGIRKKERHARRGAGGTRRYLWNAAQERAYFVDLSRRDTALIITVLVRQEARAA